MNIASSLENLPDLTAISFMWGERLTVIDGGGSTFAQGKLAQMLMKTYFLQEIIST